MNLAAVQNIGLWSYSIYLWHWPIVVAINFLDIDNRNKRYAKLIGIALSILLGALSYRFIERRFTFDRFARVWQKSVAVSLVGSALAISLCMLIIFSDGWSARANGDQGFYDNYRLIRSERIFPAACDNFQKGADHLKTCSINAGAPGSRTLVYGDSHAEHLYAWFATHARTPVDFLTSSGCPPAPGFNRRESGFRCNEFVAEALRRASADVYSTVIVAGNWGNGMDESPGNLCEVRIATCGKSDAPASRQRLIDSNVVAWSRLLAIGKTLVIVDQSPMANFDVMPTVMRRRFLHLKPIATFEEVSPPGGGPSHYIDDVMKDLPRTSKLHRVSLRSEFCNGSQCDTTDAVSGLPILVDRSHFAPFWIRAHGSAFATFVAADIAAPH